MINEMKVLKDLDYIRVGGTKEELKAANYIIKTLKELNLKGSIETFPVQAFENIETSLEVIKPYKQKIKCKPYGNVKNATNLKGELYYYRGNYKQYHDVKGKIVLFDAGVPYWAYKDIYEKGAIGFITCNGNLIDDTSDIDERELREPLRQIGMLPGVAINVNDAFKLIQEGDVELKLTTKQKEIKGESRNVVCKIKGDDPHAIVFTAHYDSTALSHGSYDNATGSVGILKIAEYYATHKPKHDLIFVWCGSEERGLLGSKAYVKKHKKDLDKISLNINLDMIGSTMGQFIACVTGEEALVHYIDYMGNEKGFGVDAYQDVYSSDSTPFADNGIPAVSFARITRLSPIHNKYDSIKMLDKNMMKQDINFILEFTKRMEESAKIPVKREMPQNMKDKIDIYLLRKESSK